MKPTPQEVISRAERLCRVHEQQTVAEIMGVSPSRITQWKKDGWRARDYSSMRRARPTDFAIRAKTMSKRELALFYRAGLPTVMRWFDETKPREHWKPGWRPGQAVPIRGARGRFAGSKPRPQPARAPDEGDEPEPSPAYCFKCGRSLDNFDGRCGKGDCPFRPHN